MFKTIISQLKTTKATALIPAELAAAESISTLDKAYARADEISKGLSDPMWTLERRSLLRKQEREITRAIAHLTLKERKVQVPEIIKNAKLAYEGEQTEAEKEQIKATEGLAHQQQKVDALRLRASKIEASLRKEQQDEAEKFSAIKKEFDSAVASGDEAAETVAADKLFFAKKALEGKVGDDSPLKIRLSAIQAEIDTEIPKLDSAAEYLEKSNQRYLKASAQLALLEYDRQFNALFEAYVAQLKAVTACSSVTADGLPKVGDFVVKGSCKDHLLIGNLPPSSIAHLAAAPDLAVLALNVNDLPVAEPSKDGIYHAAQ